MGGEYPKNIYDDYAFQVTKNEKLTKELQEKTYLLRIERQLVSSLRVKNVELQKELTIAKAQEYEKYREQLETQKTSQGVLEKEVLRLKGVLGLNGTNSHVPTSQTPIHKKKVIPNTRKKSGKKRGGQEGHPKATLKSFDTEEVTEIEDHMLESCPHCGGDVEQTGKSFHKDETDLEVVVVKRRHRFLQCKCKNCSKESYEKVPITLKEENQYGQNVKALALALMNIGNVSVNKTRKMLYGLSEQEINACEGWIIKQQKIASTHLKGFMENAKKRCIGLNTVYWDDTVIDINTKRACLRFYGDERLALYTAHQHKNKQGLDEDGILKLLPRDTVVMHDHNKVNYNAEYSFINIECNAHLLRDLEKVSEYLKREWSKTLKELISQANMHRNELMQRGECSFTDEYVKHFFEQFHFLLAQGLEDNRFEKQTAYWLSEERALLKRLIVHKNNYFAWVTNFDMPFTNNVSERALRGIKTKMKVSGQFQNVQTAQYYAHIKSYIETCYRNGINEHESLIRLCQGNPYTIDEIFNST